MAKTRLFIRPNAVNRFGTTVIYLRFSAADKSIDFSTNELIEPRFWDSRLQQVKKVYKGSSGLNNYLQKFKSDIDNLKREIQMRGITPTIKNIKEEYLKINSPQQIETMSPYALDYWDEFIKHKINTERINKGTLTHYKSTHNVLKEFETFTSTKIQFNDIDKKFYDKLVYYLYEARQNNPNTVSGRIKHLKCLCEYANENGISQNTAYKKFIKPSCESFSIAQNREQLDKIYLVDLTDSKKLDQARDIFIIGCASAFRYSDFKELTPAHIRKDHIIKFTNKTKTEIKVPLNAYSRSILAKYNGVPPKTPSKFNKLLKEIAKRAGLTEMVEKVTQPGGRVKKEQKEFFTLLSSHVARRTWASQANDRKIPMTSAMKITGHKDTKTYLKYVKETDAARDEVVTTGWDTAPKK